MDNKKVDILTFHWTVNFGGLLQAYGLQETLRNMGFDPSFINYHDKSELASVSSWKRRILQVVWDKIARLFFGREKREKITENYRKQYLNIQTVPFESYDELVDGFRNLKEYDHAYIVGSDQVWNPNLTGNPAAYLLSFLPKSACKIAYAASFGKASIPECTERQFREELPSFKAVSVREDGGADMVKNFAGVSAPVVMDPVFLLSLDEWKKIASQPVVKEDYVLCYYMNTPDKTIHSSIASVANALAQKHGCKVINIGKREFERIKFWENNLFDVGPQEFLSLVMNAKYVVTNSFHATAFSCIFHVPFFVPVNYEEPENKRLSNRMESLVQKFQCAERIIACPVHEANVMSKIQELDVMSFETVDRTIMEHRNRSIAFLEKALFE